MEQMSELPYHFGIKVRFYPSDQQKAIIKVNTDTSRFVYNQMVADGKELWKLTRVKLPIAQVQARITQLKQRQNVRELSNHFWFLNDPLVDSMTKANAIQSYRSAWNMFRKVHTAGVPTFHRKRAEQHYQTSCIYSGKKRFGLTTGSVRFTDMRHVILPKVGRLRIKGHYRHVLDRDRQGIETRIGTVTITKTASDQYYLSMQLGSTEPFARPLPKKENSQIGIDLNTENFLTDSNGAQVANPRFYRTIQGKLAKAQRKLARKSRRAKKEQRALKTAKNYQQQRLVVARLHEKVANQRRNFLQTLSTILIKNHDLVAAEELRSKNLQKNHALALSISDVGWRTFLTMLEYKAELYGRTVVLINPRNTTQTCHACGFIMGTQGTQKLELKDREWTCPHCGTSHIRDWNAAQNILTKGLAKKAQTA
ncbi:MAG: RNA-guided endonuclease TnpB family protein [Schleiferilactobacillus perolens]|uniref:RNA-guided endonuclease InsQ/TnpB family protein n=1 Tax=Schleiferilactobacillus perolens TaxID=100468 RepID=UPI0039EBF0B6